MIATTARSRSACSSARATRSSPITSRRSRRSSRPRHAQCIDSAPLGCSACCGASATRSRCSRSASRSSSLGGLLPARVGVRSSSPSRRCSCCSARARSCAAFATPRPRRHAPPRRRRARARRRHDHVHVGARALAWRPLTIGLVHGLAGSGALTALAFAELPTTAARMVYMMLWGRLVAGMALATGIAGAALSTSRAVRARGAGSRSRPASCRACVASSGRSAKSLRSFTFLHSFAKPAHRSVILLEPTLC